MQSNPQGAVLDATSVAAGAVGPIAEGNLNLNSFAEAANVEVLSVISVDSVLPAADLYFKYEIANNEAFEGAKVLDIDMEGTIGYVSVEELNTDHIQLFGKSPSAKEIYYRIPAFVKMGGTDYRIGGTDYYVASGKYMETCIDAGFKISSAYYFLSNATTWDITAPEDYKMDHSDKDVYDDPVFTFTFECDADCYWKIAPQEAVDLGNDGWDKVLGPETNGDTSFEGMLIDTDAQAGCIAEAGKYKITVNMETMKYEIAPVLYPAALAVRDQAYEWSGTNTQWLAAYNEEGGYAGTAYIDPIYGFKLTDASLGDSWDAQWAAAGAGLLGGGDNITLFPDGEEITETALYWVTADLSALTYGIAKVTTIGVVGGLNSWNQEAPIELQATENPCIWAADVDLTGEWKIVLNHTWDCNYGGSIDSPVFNGGNFSGYEGSYNVAIDFTGNLPKITLKAI